MIRAHDRGFVAAPPPEVHRVLADTGSYSLWWPGAGGTSDGPVLPLGRRRVRARPHGHREGLGLHLALERPAGGLEWYLEPFDDGTIVNAFLHLERISPDARGHRSLLRMRGSVRRALVGLKRTLEPWRAAS